MVTNEFLTLFNSKINKTDACWLWTGQIDPDGYGRVFYRASDGKLRQMAHRLSWELAHGPIPVGMLACHKCDNPLCVNPDHLFLGTQRDNMLDCKAKGRRPNGENHGMAKLTEAQVLDIRRALVGKRGEYAKLGRQYGVTRIMIRSIAIRKSWSHI